MPGISLATRVKTQAELWETSIRDKRTQKPGARVSTGYLATDLWRPRMSDYWRKNSLLDSACAWLTTVVTSTSVTAAYDCGKFSTSEMKTNSRSLPCLRPAGFTLIELLVVIAIIA